MIFFYILEILIEVWNKIDLLNEETAYRLFGGLEKIRDNSDENTVVPVNDKGVVPISAKKNINVDVLLARIEAHLAGTSDVQMVTLPFDPRYSGEVHKWLNENQLQGNNYRST